jgi:tetraacyldisaccharide 4'-kinase
VFPNEAQAPYPTLHNLASYHILLLTGIASPRQLKEDLERISPNTPHSSPHITTLSFPDHYHFRPKDVRRINEAFESLPQHRCIITTEKDATRLADTEGLNDDVRSSIFVLPVKVSLMLEQESTFNENIIGHVRKNSRNSILAKGKDDHKPHDSHRPGNGTRTISFRNN